ncbi:MAG TPA: peptidoglycan DD-metalloendopeptidase family protein [Feifaniaceae bacterium]|nr:peptidoglycan DD-metalloendopeptidase family protein [Feifaniaceae bacterium]
MKQRAWYWGGAFALVLLLLAALSANMRGLPALPAAAVLTPGPEPTLAAPTPTPVYGAVTVYVGGAPLVTLASEEEAQALLAWRLEQGSQMIPGGELLFAAELSPKAEFEAAQSGTAPVALEEAKAKITADPALMPVRCITRTAYLERVPYQTEEKEDKRLAKGSRIVVRKGREGERLTVSEAVYVNGQPECCLAVQDAVALTEPVTEQTIIGAYIAKNPGEPAGREEGQKGPEAPEGFKIALPVKGDIAANFGIGENVMRNGLDIRAKAGDEAQVPASGVVTYAGEWGSYGYVLEIDHGGGFVTRTAPLEKCALKAGDAVKRGDAAGVVASPLDEEQEPKIRLELLIGGIPYNPRQYLD